MLQKHPEKRTDNMLQWLLAGILQHTAAIQVLDPQYLTLRQYTDREMAWMLMYC